MRNFLLSLTAALLAAGCSGADGSPLGGPYGGTGNMPAPTSGDPGSSPTNGGTNPSADSGAVGNPPPNSSDGGTTPQSDSGLASGSDSSMPPPPPPTDGGNPPPPQDSGPPPPPPAPTWTQVFNSYLASGTVGDCRGCHSEMGSKSNGYNWLQGKGYINGTGSAIVDPNNSPLTWFGGNMPPQGPSSEPQAVTDMNAWVAAGAQNN